MLKLVDEAEAILTDRDCNLDEFGRLLDYTWKLKRGLSSAVSTDSIDSIYRKALDAGALGGKLLGAGGGGFLIFYVNPEHKQAVKDALSDLLYVPFRFETGGTSIIHFSPESYMPKDREND